MAKVTGLGGVFVKTSDKDRLARFYKEALGMDLADWGGAQLYPDEAGPPRFYNVWNAFEADSAYFKPSSREFMINLRVDDLQGVLARARAFGAQVLDRGESGEYGSFGYVVDPDGTLVELWQPAPDEAK